MKTLFNGIRLIAILLFIQFNSLSQGSPAADRGDGIIQNFESNERVARDEENVLHFDLKELEPDKTSKSNQKKSARQEFYPVWYTIGMVIIFSGPFFLFFFFSVGWWAFLIAFLVMMLGLIVCNAARPKGSNRIGRMFDFIELLPAILALMLGIGVMTLSALIIGLFQIFG